MATEHGHEAAAGGEVKPVVLPYAGPGNRPPNDGGWPNTFKIGLLTGILFFIAACAIDPHVALLVLVLGAMFNIGVRMAEDGCRPAWLVVTVALLAGVVMVAIGLQASIIASDPGHPQSRWRSALFKPSIVAVPALAATVAMHRQATKRRP